ncbi:hypothetical protein HYPSUDRAFT_67866 [Hypholoma sublateritium FD-334 SS-4]|uniref:Uncharacterized protein n=1 Tax=Hypholoma sublateritium (strain FD-334 SS-4) TaxID=945553 RepID=A0A0D2NRE8_HYPSF|nr:hypothetical protein HYPSUDRAFT_67866 [Hypholoma sublateritium FD-334 SS-4]
MAKKMNQDWNNRPDSSMKSPDMHLSGDQVEIDGAEKHVLGILGARWKEYASGQEGWYAKNEAGVRDHERNREAPEK